MYLTGCASECEEQNVQRFVVGVEEVEVTSASSSELKGVHRHGTELEAAIGEAVGRAPVDQLGVLITCDSHSPATLQMTARSVYHRSP